MILDIFLLYCASSLLFLLFPNLIRKQRNNFNQCRVINQALDREGVLIVAHRGGSCEAIQNTIESFENGVKKGANILEMDVCLTQDGHLVVFHDNHLLRMCGIDSYIHELNFSELPTFQPEIKIDFTIGETLKTGNFKSRNIPLLQEVFQKFPDMAMNIQIKIPNQRTVTTFHNLVKKYNRRHLVTWGCQDYAWSVKLRELDPEINRFFSVNSVLKTFLLFVTGLLPYFELVGESFQPPSYSEFYQGFQQLEHTKGLNRFQVHLGFAFLSVFSFFQPLLFHHLTKRGIPVFPWVFNTEQDFQRVSRIYATGIMTDKPTLLKQFLIKNKLYISNKSD